MKKLLIVTSTYPRFEGDARSARFVHHLAVSLKDYYEVHVLAPHSPGSSLKEAIDGVTVHRFRYFIPVSLEALSSGGGMLSDIRRNPLALLQAPLLVISEFFAALGIIRREGVDIVNSHWVVPQGFVCGLLKSITGVTHVMTAHAAGVFLLKRRGGPGKTLARFIGKRTDLMLPVSGYIKQQLAGLTSRAGAYETIPMGVDTDKFLPAADKRGLRSELGIGDRFTFLFVGKFAEKKGIPVLLDAASMLKKRGKDFTLILAGGGAAEEKMKNRASELGLSDNTRFLGWVDNDLLPRFFSASDSVVVPSVFDGKGETEGMPVVVNEALASGVPVIASEISGIPDIVEDGRNGWLCAPGNASELSEKMEFAMDSPSLGEFSRNAVETAKKNSFSRTAERYRDAVDRAAGGDAGAAGRQDICDMSLDIHGNLRVGIYSRHGFYVEHFKKEYPEMFWMDGSGELSDIRVFIDRGLPSEEEGDIVLNKKFKGVYRYKCLIRGLDRERTEVWFNTPLSAVFLYPSMAAVFLQAEILEPVVYFRALRKGMLMMHASGVFDEKGGYLFGASTGTGKTTAAFHLVSRGFGFLGDDLVFLTKEGRIYSYPKRVHFFSYLREKNPFLKVPAGMMLRARLRHAMRTALKAATGKHFYLSTRVDIREMMPSARIGTAVPANRIFLLKKSGISVRDMSEKDKMDYVIGTCDTRESLSDNLLGGRPDLREYMRRKEYDIISGIADVFSIEDVYVEDIVKDSEKIADMIKGAA